MNGAPRPQGNYRITTDAHGFLFTAGLTPRRDGDLQFTGTIGADLDLDAARAAAELCARNATRALRDHTDEELRLVRTTVYLVCAPGFTQHARVADAASAVLAEHLDGVGVRTTVGVASLPGGAPVEIDVIATTTVSAATTSSSPAPSS